MFDLPDATLKDLAQLESSFCLIHRQNRIIAHIVDDATGRKYAKGEGPTEPDAVVAAVNEAKVVGKPLRPHEIIRGQESEIVQLKEQVADLCAKLGQPVPAVTKPADAFTAVPTATLVNMLEERGLPVPAGDKRGKAWRDAAVAALAGGGNGSGVDDDSDANV